jgi:hypothetical protein
MLGTALVAETGYSAGYLLAVLVVAAAFAVISGLLMDKAGHPFWAGALLGFFCGIFGLVVAIAFYFARDRRPPVTYGPQAPYQGYGYGPPGAPPPPYSQQPYQQPPEYYGQQQPLQPVPPPPPEYPGAPRQEIDPRALPAAPVEHAAAGTLVCPQCGSHVRAGTEFCASCGVYLHPSHHQEVRSSCKVCPVCHTTADAGDEFCRRCGEGLSETAAW